MTAATAHAQSVTGFVRDSAGRPLSGADVAIEALSRHATTDPNGRYLIADIPAGLRLVRARMLGHAAVANLVKLAAGETKTMDFSLERVPLTLDTVVVKDRKNVAGIGFAAMEERRKLGFGKFLDSTFLRKNEHRQLRDVMREIPQTYVATAPDQVCRVIRGSRYCYTLPHGMQVAASRRLANRDACLMEVFLDGVRVQPGSQPGESPPRWERAFDLRSAPIAGLDGVEFYRGAAETPMEYSGSSECGVILLWTHRIR
ncbi:MAG: carboxypeptidase-like regulatory domain-containing protein [Gemmatimonadaceae bacterium]